MAQLCCSSIAKPNRRDVKPKVGFIRYINMPENKLPLSKGRFRVLLIIGYYMTSELIPSDHVHDYDIILSGLSA